MQLSFTLAMIAGLVSFLSPCVLPLVPAYIGYMGGRVTNTVAAQTAGGAVALKPSVGSRFSTLLHGLAFVAGFTFVFVAIGLLSTAFINQIGRQNVNIVTGIIGRAGGLLIIFFGLHFMGVMPSIFNRLLARRQRLNNALITIAAALVIGVALMWVFEDWLFALPLFALALLWMFLGGGFTQPEAFWTKFIVGIQRALYTDTRKQMIAQGHQSYAGSAIMGVIFSAGWTPCIGPIYGSILTMAAMGGDVATAGSLLLAYSLGLGIPFLVTAFLLDGAANILRHLQRHLHKIELVSGAFLVVIGVLVASGRLQTLSQNFATQFADFSYNLEECVIKLIEGEITLGELPGCINEDGSTAPTDAQTGEIPSILDVAANAPEIRETGLEVGKVAPAFSAKTDTGAAFNLADQHGKVVVLNFWATWCPPCRAEMPGFENIYADRAQDGVVIVGVNNGETVADIAAFRDRLSLTFPLLVDADASLQRLYGIPGYPVTYVLDGDGVIVARHLGGLSAEELDEFIDQAMA